MGFIVAKQSFVKNKKKKHITKWQNYSVGEIMTLSRSFNVANWSSNVFHEIKLLRKILNLQSL